MRLNPRILAGGLLLLALHWSTGQACTAEATAAAAQTPAIATWPHSGGESDTEETGRPAAAVRRRALQEIQQRGGEIEWDRSAPGQRVAGITLLEEPLADGDLVLLEPISELRELPVRGLGISDAGLAPLASLAGLEALRINYTQITDAGLAGLEKLGQLRRLDLTGCFRVTDAGLEHLKRLPKLQIVNLTSTRVSDQGVAALRKARPDLEVRRTFVDPLTGSAKRPTRKDVPFLSSFLRGLRSKALQQRANVFKLDQDWTGLAVALDDVLQSHPNEILLPHDFPLKKLVDRWKRP